MLGQEGDGAGKQWFDKASFHGTGRDESVPIKQKMFFWEVSLSRALSVFAFALLDSEALLNNRHRVRRAARGD
jgi:hypothetical protein